MTKQILVKRDEQLRLAAHNATGPAKAEAAWEFYRRLNVDTVEHRKQEVLCELGELFGGEKVTGEVILKIANIAAYRVHLSLVKHGYSYDKLKEAFCEDPQVLERLFHIAREIKESLPGKIADLGQEMATSNDLTTETILYRGLNIFGTFYPASHIVRQYSEEKGLAEPAL